MAMIRVEPMEVQVRTDWFNGRPRQIRWNARQVPVTRVLGVRDETAAFPVTVGPRTIFDVSTPVARLTLSYRHRTRRWAIEGVDAARRAA